MGHTPGAWKAFRFFVAAEGSLRRIADCQSKMPGDPDYNDQAAIDEDCANARLIAAAPELLEACRDALPYIEQYAATRYDHAFLSRLRAAILKAEGQPLTKPETNADA